MALQISFADTSPEALRLQAIIGLTKMSWYVVNTKPRQECLAEVNLKRLGLETFLPQLKENRVIRKKQTTVVAPLFPGYFFARFNINSHYRAVHFAHGVRNVITYGAVPAEIDETLIMMIRSRMKHDYLVIQPSSFNPGQIVRIQSGPFEGLEAVFEREMTAKHRVVLLLKTLLCQHKIIIDRECIQAC